MESGSSGGIVPERWRCHRRGCQCRPGCNWSARSMSCF